MRAPGRFLFVGHLALEAQVRLAALDAEEAYRHGTLDLTPRIPRYRCALAALTLAPVCGGGGAGATLAAHAAARRRRSRIEQRLEITEVDAARADDDIGGEGEGEGEGEDGGGGAVADVLPLRRLQPLVRTLPHRRRHRRARRRSLVQPVVSHLRWRCRRARRRRRRRRGERRRRRRDGGAGGEEDGDAAALELRQRTDTPGGERPVALQFPAAGCARVQRTARRQSCAAAAARDLRRSAPAAAAAGRLAAPARARTSHASRNRRHRPLRLSRPLRRRRRRRRRAAGVAAALGALLYEATLELGLDSAAAAAEGAAADAATADAAAAAAHLAALGGFGGWLGVPPPQALAGVAVRWRLFEALMKHARREAGAAPQPIALRVGGGTQLLELVKAVQELRADRRRAAAAAATLRRRRRRAPTAATRGRCGGCGGGSPRRSGGEQAARAASAAAAECTVHAEVLYRCLCAAG